MDAARRLLRMQPVMDDTGERGALYIEEPESDWPEDWHETREAWPDWRCWECGSPNCGWFADCGYCGADREDLDALP